MTTIKKLATKMLAMLSVVGLMASPVQALDAADMAFALGGQAPASARSMSAVEMDATDGAALPVFVAAAIGAALRQVTVKAAVNIARKNTVSPGVYIHASTRQQAQQIAKAASGGNKKGIRHEVHTPRPEKPIQYKHYHAAGSKAHITYGKPRR
jgi:hypothetical protein